MNVPLHAKTFYTKATLLLVSSLTVMAGATIAPALPSMQAHFQDIEHAGFWIRLMLTLPALLIVIAAPIAGIIIDRKGRLRLLIPSMILYGLAGSSGLYLESLGALLAGRALLGVAVAGVLTTATTLVADYFDGPERSQFMGWQAAFMSFGGVVFLTGGGALAELGWRWPFTIYLFSILMIPLVLFTLHEPVRKSTEIAPSANVSMNIGRGRLLGIIYGVGFTGMTIFYFIPLLIPFYLESYTGAGPAASGFAIAVATLSGMITSLNYGRIRERLGYISIFGINFGLMGTGYLIIGLSGGYYPVLAGLAVCGLGMGLMFPNLNVWLTSEVPAAMRGRTVGGLTTAIFLGQFLSPVVSQPLVGLFGLEITFWSSGLMLLTVTALFLIFRTSILSFTARGSMMGPGSNSGPAAGDLDVSDQKTVPEQSINPANSTSRPFQAEK